MSWEDRFERKPVGTGLLFLVGGIILVVVIGIALWGAGVIFSPVKGAGDAYNQKNSAQNWTAAQRQFNQDYQDVQAFQSKIRAAESTVNEHKASPQPTDSLGAYQWQQTEQNYEATVTGLQQQCQNTVASYNTDARSYLSEQFRDADLPAQLDPSMCS